jgi:hypothetical protein
MGIACVLYDDTVLGPAPQGADVYAEMLSHFLGCEHASISKSVVA